MQSQGSNETTPKRYLYFHIHVILILPQLKLVVNAGYLGKRSAENDIKITNPTKKPKKLNPEQKPEVQSDSELRNIMDAQVEKIKTDEQWTDQWMTNYEGYQPIGEPPLPLPQPRPMKTHQCKICQEGFSTAHYLKCHEIVHSDKRPFGKFNSRLLQFFRNSF